jgi:uncharacterized protein (DUF1778 family)
MTTAREARNNRIELRTTTEEKSLLMEAATHERLDVTAFVMRAALPAARAVVARAQQLAVSQRDARQILELLESPPEPTEALIAAARRRNRRTT